jgi:orotate phosphoribosyltransferase
MSKKVRERILALAKARGALKFGRFVLTSGQRSSFYFDGRLLSLDPEGVSLIASEVLAVAKACKADAIGGPTLGADPIVGAAVALSHRTRHPVSGFIVRSEPKRYGTRKSVEGDLPKGGRVMIVDDVCTTGGSLFRAIAAAEAEECQVVKVLVVLDRAQGGSDQLRKAGYDLEAMLEASPEGKVRVSTGVF